MKGKNLGGEDWGALWNTFASTLVSSYFRLFWSTWLWVHVLQCLRYPCLEFHLESSIGELSFFIYFVTTWLKAQAKHQTSIKFNKPSKQKNFISYFQPSLNCRHHSRSILQRSPFQCLVYSLSASWRRTRFISMPAMKLLTKWANVNWINIRSSSSIIKQKSTSRPRKSH